jgi:methionyl-tRNA formyltransferase
MRIVYLANNRVGLEVLKWLMGQDDEVVALVVHPPDRQRYGEEILATAGLPAERVFHGDRLGQEDALRQIEQLKPDIGVSVLFGYLLRRRFLRIFPQGCVNLHPALLPYNRGANPNVWSIVDGTPAGVTLHYVDEGVDTGDVMAQREVVVLPTDTGQTLYRRLEKACVQLFCHAWQALRSGQARGSVQRQDAGTAHRVRDLASIDAIDLDGTYTARRLIDVIRARTFPPYAGAYIEREGKRIYLRLQLLTEEELGEEQPARSQASERPRGGIGV